MKTFPLFRFGKRRAVAVNALVIALAILFILVDISAVPVLKGYLAQGKRYGIQNHATVNAGRPNVKTQPKKETRKHVNAFVRRRFVDMEKWTRNRAVVKEEETISFNLLLQLSVSPTGAHGNRIGFN